MIHPLLLLSLFSYLPEMKDQLSLSFSSQLHQSLHFVLILISRYSSISLLPNSTISLLPNIHVCFNDPFGVCLLYFFNQKIMKLPSSSSGYRLQKSTIIRRKTPSFIIFSFFSLLPFFVGDMPLRVSTSWMPLQQEDIMNMLISVVNKFFIVQKS